MIPKIGRIVHFVLPNGPHAGEHRPAIIVHVGDAPTQEGEEQTVSLQVFTENARDHQPNVIWQPKVRHDNESKERGTWHEPERDEVTEPAKPAATDETKPNA